jgi:DNA-directed RNA polymerase subunit omega
MARITVEDCLDRVGNRFALVILASQRTRHLKEGHKAVVECKNKEEITSLREIADGYVSFEENLADVLKGAYDLPKRP